MSTRKSKRPGTIEPPRDTIKTTQTKVIVETIIKNRPRKKTMIITTYETYSSITIYIGNYNIYCIDCQLLKDKNTGTADTGILTKARWDIGCSIDDPFEKGVDSIIIIKLLLTYIKNTYPAVKQILFTDMSSKDCDNGSSVNLAAMKVFTDGATWYESHFNVSMENIHRNLYDIMKKNATDKKKEISFDRFTWYANIETLQISKGNLKNKYENSNTWQEFFSYIRDSIGISNYCKWLSRDNWFDTFVYTILKFNTLSLQFIFEPQQYDITYTLINTIGGKFNRTRKNRSHKEN